MTQPKQPPPGVETTPGGPVVSLAEAAKRLEKDPRTIIRAITAGEIRGGAMPRPQRLRWYVYADELPPQLGAVLAPPSPDVDELRAQVVSLTEANRLLIAAQQDLLDADRSTNEAAEKYRAVARNYLDALGQFMTPGNLGELAHQL
ncbi:hypothetical protein ACRDU6_00860 (plasmid) [Mycolicibacterium sp. ELW1]|uniref:hypothetical protein n=1 Tax=Mycobacteriaceae TaxID=1762 RepID=UPI0011EC2DCB|nr:hypothetical protein [Mycobacterium sp. ELW1]QEN17520.1 hypothetical protein D3H54_29960 [Mycobacterium sp. ELW1]